MDVNDELSLTALLDDIGEFKQVHKLGDAFNIFEAVGMRTQEIRHSRFLAFLLNPSAPHGLDDHFLRGFLDYALVQNDASTMTRLDIMLADFSAVEIYTERDNFDITIRLPKQKLLIVIENKVKASEYQNQLRNYRELAMQQYPDENFFGIFLTMDGREGEDPSWLSIDYDTICVQLKALLEDSTLTLSADVRIAINHYLQLIRRHIVADEKLIEACKKIYIKHRHAFDLVIEHGKVTLLGEAVKCFIDKTSELQVAPGGNNLRVDMVACKWMEAQSFQVAVTVRNRSSCPLIICFELNEESTLLSLCIDVRPVKEEENFDRLNFVQKLRHEFHVSTNKITTEKNTRIKRYSKSLDVDDIDSIVDAMKKLWINFGGVDRLEKIDTIIEQVTNKSLPTS